MIPAAFDYVVARDPSEAVELLVQPGARLLAGGQSLIPSMKLREMSPSLLIDIRMLRELRGIEVSADEVRMGALTTHREIEDSSELADVLPVMREAARVVSDPNVRSQGTLGGSLAFADSNLDWPAVALALGGQVQALGQKGERSIDMDGFFVGQRQTVLQPAELVTHVTVKIPPLAAGTGYLKLRHPASGYALVGVAAVMGLDQGGTCNACRIAITGAGPVASRAKASEAALLGQKPEPGMIAEAAGKAAEGMEFLSDVHAGEEYRANLVRVHVRRALQLVLSRISP